MTLSLTLDGLPLRARIEAGELEIEPGDIDDPDVTVDGDPNLLAGLVYGGLSLKEVRAAGLRVSGDSRVHFKPSPLSSHCPTKRQRWREAHLDLR